MSRERLLARQLAIKSEHRVDRLQGLQIERGGRTILLERQDHPPVIDHMSVSRAAAQTPHARIIHGRVSVNGHEASSGLVLCHIAFGARETAAIIHAAVADAEHSDVSLAVKWDIPTREWILGVGAGGIKAAAEIGRQFSFDRAIPDVHLGTQWGEVGAAQGCRSHRIMRTARRFCGRGAGSGSR